MNEKDSYTNILIAGHSRGGFVAMLTAARDKRITMIVSIMGSTGVSVSADVKKQLAWE